MEREDDFLNNLKRGLKEELKKKQLLNDVLSEGWLPSKDLIFRGKLKAASARRQRGRRRAAAAAAAVLAAACIAGILLVRALAGTAGREDMAVRPSPVPDYIHDVPLDTRTDISHETQKPEPEFLPEASPEPRPVIAEEPAPMEHSGHPEESREIHHTVQTARTSIPTAVEQNTRIKASISRSSHPALISAQLITGSLEDVVPSGYTLAQTTLEGDQTNVFLIKNEPETPRESVLSNVLIQSWY